MVAGWQLAERAHFVEGPELPVGTWTHLALTVTPARLGAGPRWDAVLYVNGAPAASAEGLPDRVDTFNERPFRCGFADVDVDEIRVWRLARAPDALAAGVGRRLLGSEPGLVGYWRLDERGQIALDYTARGRVGVLGALTTPDPADPSWILDGAI